MGLGVETQVLFLSSVFSDDNQISNGDDAWAQAEVRAKNTHLVLPPAQLVVTTLGPNELSKKSCNGEGREAKMAGVGGGVRRVDKEKRMEQSCNI